MECIDWDETYPKNFRAFLASETWTAAFVETEDHARVSNSSR
jgi:hypothetical protein